jgi:hypothetical protein
MVNFVTSGTEDVDFLAGKDFWVGFKVVVTLHALINVLVLNKGELPIPNEQIVLDGAKSFTFLDDLIFVHGESNSLYKHHFSDCVIFLAMIWRWCGDAYFGIRSI